MYDTFIERPLTQSQRRCMQLSWFWEAWSMLIYSRISSSMLFIKLVLSSSKPLPRRLEHGKMEYVRISYREFNDDNWKEISVKYFDPKKSGFLKSLSADAYYFVHIDANNTEGFNKSFVQTPIVIPSVDHGTANPLNSIDPKLSIKLLMSFFLNNGPVLSP